MRKQYRQRGTKGPIQRTQIHNWLSDAPTTLPLTTGSRGRWIGAFVIVRSITALAVTIAAGSVSHYEFNFLSDASSLIVGFAIYASSEKISRRGINGIVAGCTSLITIEISTGYNKDPSIVAIVFCVWVALYVFSFLSTAESLFHVALIIFEYTAALIFGSRPDSPVTDWILIVSTVAIASITSGYLNYTLRKVAITDPLTSLSNRKGWELAAPREMSRALRNHQHVMLVMIDMDAFKEINDSQGHQTGDRVLVDTARAILECIHPFDVDTRWGGDEFILLSVLHERNAAKAIIERLVTRIQEVCSTSCGAIVSTPDMHLDDLIKAADQALYVAKFDTTIRYHLVEV